MVTVQSAHGVLGHWTTERFLIQASAPQLVNAGSGMCYPAANRKELPM